MTRVIDNFSEALVAAAEAHYGQKRLDGEPFIMHPLRVSFETARNAFFEEAQDMMIAALLHDVVEDSYWSVEQIERRFGPVVGTIVDALTRKPDENYMDYIRRAGADSRARLIKKYDIEDNLRHVNLISDSMVVRYTRALSELETMS